MNESKKICRFGRIHFIGDSKPVEEIFGILERLNSTSLGSKERLLGLEELCIFTTSSHEAVERLSSMGAAIHFTKSLASHDAGILLRAAHLISYLCEYSQTCAKQVIDNGGILYLKGCLSSPDEVRRFVILSVTYLNYRRRG